MSASTTKILVLLLFTGSLVSATGLFWTKKQEAASDPVDQQAEEDKPEKQGLFSRFRNFFCKPKNKTNPEKRKEVISYDFNHNPEKKHHEIQTIKISNKIKDVRYKEAANIVVTPRVEAKNKNEERRYKIDLARGNKDRQKKTFTAKGLGIQRKTYNTEEIEYLETKGIQVRFSPKTKNQDPDDYSSKNNNRHKYKKDSWKSRSSKSNKRNGIIKAKPLLN